MAHNKIKYPINLRSGKWFNPKKRFKMEKVSLFKIKNLEEKFAGS